MLSEGRGREQLDDRIAEQGVALTAAGSTQVTQITAPQVARATRTRVAKQAAVLLCVRGAPVERIAVHLLNTTPGNDGAAATLRSAASRAVDRGAPGGGATTAPRAR